MIIKILHIVSSLSIGSGVMSTIMNFYRKIDKSKVQFDFVYFYDCIEQETYKEEIIKNGGKTYYVTKPTVYAINKFTRDLTQIINKNIYKAIHLHEVYLNLLIGPIARRNNIKNIISHSHTTIYSDNKLKAIRNKILCIPLKKQVNIFFACSRAAGKFLYGNDSDVYIMNNAIDCNKFRFNETIRNDIRERLNLKDKFVVGHIGRFSKQKNHSFLIDIFSEIKKVKENSVLILIGNGNLKCNIKEKVRRLNLDDYVKFLNDRKDINELLQGMDIFLLPSLFEGLPVSGIEAQSTGLPCIVSNKITEELNLGNCKYISLDKSAKLWAKEIINCGSDYIRKDNFIEITKKGFNIESEARKLEEFYINLQ